MKKATGTTSLNGDRLIIKTTVKRGKKTVQHVTMYRVRNLHPDRRVADPAYALTKGLWVGDDFTAMGEEYHVSVDSFGPSCTCPHATFRGGNSRVPCKHCLSLQAVGLLPKG